MKLGSMEALKLNFPRAGMAPRCSYILWAHKLLSGQQSMSDMSNPQEFVFVLYNNFPINLRTIVDM